MLTRRGLPPRRPVRLTGLPPGLVAWLLAGLVATASTGCSSPPPADPAPQGWHRVDLGRLSFALPAAWSHPSRQPRAPFAWGRNDGQGPYGSVGVMVAPQIDERDADLAVARLVAVAQAGGLQDFEITGQGPLAVRGATSGAWLRFRYTTGSARTPQAGFWIAAADRPSWHASVLALTGDAVPFGLEQGVTTSLRLVPAGEIGGPDGGHLPVPSVGA